MREASGRKRKTVAVVATSAPALMMAGGSAVGGDSDRRLACHASSSPGIVEQWKLSRHFDMDVGCLDCHQAAKGEPDAFGHHGETIPQLEEAAGPEVAKELLEKHVYGQEGHLWHRDGMSQEALQRIQAFYQKRDEQ